MSTARWGWPPRPRRRATRSGLAVLTALNIADELFRARDQQLDDADSLTARAAALERIVDQALQLAGHGD